MEFLIKYIKFILYIVLASNVGMVLIAAVGAMLYEAKWFIERLWCRWFK